MGNRNIYVITGSLLGGLFLGWIFFAGGNEAGEEHIHSAMEDGGETVWTCSMHPQVRQNEPGDCPICGMDLIPLEEEVTEADPKGLHMSENAMKLANVQTREVGAESATREIRLNGRVAVDERRVSVQSTHIPGRIERLLVNFEGERVNRGQALAVVYSPEMVTAQEELLQAYAIRESQPELFEAATEKLRSWRIGEKQINQILENQQASQQFTITADVGGIVTEKMVELGDYVERGAPLYEIADLSTVWILFDVYENNMNWIDEGSTVEFTVASIPGETFEGVVEFIDPLVNRQTRVATARVVVNNSQGRLKPEMFVSGIIKNPVESGSEELTVPRSAVLWTGQRSVVYVKQNEDNRILFTLREVVLGPSLGDAYVVREGLQPGEEIVVNGTFTVDAAAQLAGKPSMMNPDLREDDMNMLEDLETYLQNNSISYREEISPDFQQKVSTLVAHYLRIKDALVEGDADEAKSHSRRFFAALDEMEGQELQEEAREFWNERRINLLEHSGRNSEADELDELRENFVFLSEEVIKTATAFGVGSGDLYVDYCPMANSDAGAYWLSQMREIRNPYYGEAMLTCGEVVTEIE